jgi:lipopolysaccharide export system protein LptA
MKLMMMTVSAITVMAGFAVAQDTGGSVDISANEMEILETDKKTIFRGNVVAKRPSDTISCEEMTVDYIDVKQPDGSTNSDADKINCKTNVVITTSSQKITGNRALFFLRTDKLEVEGNVKVQQGKNVVRGPKMFVDLKTRRTKIVGGVTGTVEP